MGRKRVGIRNENGNLFVDFSARNNLIIGGSLFKLKKIHNVTSISPRKK